MDAHYGRITGEGMVSAQRGLSFKPQPDPFGAGLLILHPCQRALLLDAAAMALAAGVLVTVLWPVGAYHA